jgi:hypothetical protein
MKLPKGYALSVPFPPGSGPLVLSYKGQPIQELPYVTSDVRVVQLANAHRNCERIK